jgi:hypothetical protein
MIKKTEIARSHGKHVELSGMVPHAVPLVAFLSLSDLIVPRPCARFALEKPISHPTPAITNQNR